MRIWKTVSVVGIAALLTACAATKQSVVEEGGERLSEADLQALYGNGLTIAWSSVRGTSGTGAYTGEGGAFVDFGDGSWSGTWRIAGDTFCTSYPERNNGAERCSSVYKQTTGDYAWFDDDETFGGTFTVTQ